MGPKQLQNSPVPQIFCLHFRTMFSLVWTRKWSHEGSRMSCNNILETSKWTVRARKWVQEDWKLIKSFGIEWNRLLTMSWGQSFSRVPERTFRYDRQQIKRRMTWCQLSWLSRCVIGPWKLLCPVSKVKEKPWSLVIFFHFLILLLPVFAPLLHPPFRWGL